MFALAHAVAGSLSCMCLIYHNRLLLHVSISLIPLIPSIGTINEKKETRMSSNTLKPALQAAGHAGAMQNDAGDLFYKPTDPNEAGFYQLIASEHPDLQSITPQFYGTLSVNDESANISLPEGMALPTGTDASGVKKEKDQLIVLKSALYGFEEPCVLDVKLGKQLWDDDAPQEKRDRLDKVSAETTSGTLSLRLAGMNVYDDSEEGKRIPYDKHYGRNLKTEEFESGLAKFFPFPIGAADKSPKAQHRQEQIGLVLDYFLNRLKHIHSILSTKEFVMRAGSLLFVYEGKESAFTSKLDKFEALQKAEADDKEPAAEEDADEEEDEVTAQDVQDQLFKLDLIDFAHTRFTPGKGPDEGVLKGIQVLIDTFEKYVAERA